MKKIILAMVFAISSNAIANNLSQCDKSTTDKETQCTLNKYRQDFGEGYVSALLLVVEDIKSRCGEFNSNTLALALIEESKIFDYKRTGKTAAYKKGLGDFSCKNYLKTLSGGEDKLKILFYRWFADQSQEKAGALASVEKDVARQCGKRLLLNEVVTLSKSDLLSAYLDKRFADYQTELSSFQCAGFGY